MSDSIGTLAVAASKAQAALATAQAEQTSTEATAADERVARGIAWSWVTITAYRGRQAIASETVTAALAAFEAAVGEDFVRAPAAYVDIVRAMAAANALGEDFVRARNILKTAGKLPRIQRAWRDPVGESAPFPLDHGMARLPGFLELVAESLDRQRMAASRAVSAEDPSAFTGKANRAMQTDALRAEWTLASEFETLLAVKVQRPDSFAKLSVEEQADTLAYEATREAAGYDAELPPIVLTTTPGPTEQRPTDGFRLFGQDGHAPASRN